MAVKLTDGGHLAKMADGRIIRFDASGKPAETLRPGDTRYGFWLSLLYPTPRTPEIYGHGQNESKQRWKDKPR